MSSYSENSPVLTVNSRGIQVVWYFDEGNDKQCGLNNLLQFPSYAAHVPYVRLGVLGGSDAKLIIVEQRMLTVALLPPSVLLRDH